MLFKVYSFCVRPVHRPIKKHGVDDDDYMGPYQTPFKYRDKTKDSSNLDKKKQNKMLDSVIGVGGVGYE